MLRGALGAWLPEQLQLLAAAVRHTLFALYEQWWQDLWLHSALVPPPTMLLHSTWTCMCWHRNDAGRESISLCRCMRCFCWVAQHALRQVHKS